MAKLDESTKAEAALVIHAMYVSHRMTQWLVRFFSVPSFHLISWFFRGPYIA